jgi:hemolysin activation/secretion protein
VDQTELNRLGRASPDDEWLRLYWDVGSSVFLEPILFPEAWSDPSSPESSTLAHELSARFLGQYAFGDRLIPQEQQVAGGLYTVRGYPESATAGDAAYIGRFEYKFHIPRVLRVEPQPAQLMGDPFRFAPQQPYGSTDWDLVPKAFIDVGHVVTNANAGSGGDGSETLVGAGIGVDVVLKRNLRARLDWGFALNDAAGFSSGNERVHFNVSVLY